MIGLVVLSENLLDEAEEWGKEHPRTGGVAAKLHTFEKTKTLLTDRYWKTLTDEQREQLLGRMKRYSDIKEKYS